MAFSASERIRSRLRERESRYNANSNVAAALEPGDLEEMQREVEVHAQAMLQALVIDTETDHNTRETAKRFAKMLIHEVFLGRYTEPPALTDFPNVANVDELYTVGPIAVRSACAHHLVPIMGHAWIGVVPGERVIGLSKFHRLTEWVMARPQIQEEAVVMLADALESAIKPRGLAVVVRARHLCCAWRGVRDEASEMTSSVMRGILKEDGNTRREFLSLIAGQGHRA